MQPLNLDSFSTFYDSIQRSWDLIFQGQVRYTSANKDDKVTIDEFLTVTKRRFKEIDKNGDGFISVQEHDIYWSQKPAPAKKTK